MRRISPILALAVLAACADTDVPTAPDSNATTTVNALASARAAAGSYIVVLKPDANPRSVAAITGVNPSHVYEAALNGFSAELNGGQLNALRHNRNVAYVEADQVVALSPPCGTKKNPCDGGGGGGGTSQVTPWGVARVGGGISAVGKTAWIIDTGVDLDNADLNVDVARSVNFTRNGTADDGNGHGTHVAGTIAAIDNDIDVIGVAAGATVVSVRVLDNRGSGQYSWVIAGVDYVAANGRSGDVANMSLSGGASDAVDDAVRNAASKGIRFALAAGNEGADANLSSPARANGTNIYTISAIATNDCLTSWSNWSNPPVDFAEPGNGIVSLRRGGGTTTMSGTSMAAPHAAGLLLIGGIRSGGTACSDPDGNADIIGIH
jgi:subtilisin family serine protease